MDNENLLKHMSALQIMDINTIETGNDLIKYFTGKSMKYDLSFKLENYDEAFQIAEEALMDYENFKRRVHIMHPELQMMVASYVACWDLAVINLHVLTGRIRCEEVDLAHFKDLIIVAYPCRYISLILRPILVSLGTIFLQNRFYEVAKALNIIYLENIKLLKETPMDEEDIQLDYLMGMFTMSAANLEPTTSSSVSQEAKDKIFETLIQELFIEDHNRFPALIKTFDDAKKVFAYILPQVQEYTKTASNEIGVFFETKYWHGSIYYDLSIFQKSDPTQKCKLVQKSIEYWKPLLDKRYQLHDMQEYVKTDEPARIMFNDLWDKQSHNYEIILIYKAKVVMRFNREQALDAILELNAIRSDYIALLNVYEQYTNQSETVDHKALALLFYKIATQKRFMIYEDKNEQNKILDESIEDLRNQYIQLEELQEFGPQSGGKPLRKLVKDKERQFKNTQHMSLIKLVKSAIDMPENLTIQTIAAKIDEHPFIRRFRRN